MILERRVMKRVRLGGFWVVGEVAELFYYNFMNMGGGKDRRGPYGPGEIFRALK